MYDELVVNIIRTVLVVGMVGFFALITFVDVNGN